MPCRATEEAPGFCRVAKTGARGNSSLEPLMGFLNLSLLRNSRGTAILEGITLQVTGQSVESSGWAVFIPHKFLSLQFCLTLVSNFSTH